MAGSTSPSPIARVSHSSALGDETPVWVAGSILPGPRPRVPDDEQQHRDLGGAEEQVILVRLADRRSHDRDAVQDRQHNVGPAAHRRPEDQGKEDHHARDRDVDRDREQGPA